MFMFATKTPEYVLLINNRPEIDDVKNQLKSDLDFNEEWTLHNKNPWEGFNGSITKGNRNQ